MIVLISHASKVMLKILQARLQQYMNRELPNVQAGFRKGRGTRDQIANIHWIMGKAALATGLEKVSFHSNPKERQCQRRLKLLHNCTHLTH